MKYRWLVRLFCAGTLVALASNSALAQDSSNVPDTSAVAPVCAFRQLNLRVEYDPELSPVVDQLQELGVFEPYIAVYLTEQSAPILLGEGANYQQIPPGVEVTVGDHTLTHYAVVQMQEADVQAFVQKLLQIGCSPIENTQEP